MRRALTGAVMAAAILAALPAAADDLEEGGQLYAIQNRKHVVSHEFVLGLGTVPMDAYYKGITGTASYTFHFTDLWAWEIVQASYSLNLATDLRNELESNWGVKPIEFPELRYFGDSNVVLKPLYGKFAFLNDSLIYGELYFVLGPSLAQYENAGIFVGADAGMGLRFYLSEYFAIRFDIRDYYFLSPSQLSDTNNELFLQGSLGLNVR